MNILIWQLMASGLNGQHGPRGLYPVEVVLDRETDNVLARLLEVNSALVLTGKQLHATSSYVQVSTSWLGNSVQKILFSLANNMNFTTPCDFRNNSYKT